MTSSPAAASRSFAFAGFLVVRTPLLPFSDYLHLIEGCVSVERDERRRHAQQRLRDVAARPEAREALFIASPSLFERTTKWEPQGNEGRARKTQAALYKYVSRMAYRCTPFGLFAGVSWGEWQPKSVADQHSGIDLAGRDEYRRHVRLDMSAVTALAERLLGDPAVRQGIEYLANPTLERFGAVWHYAQPTGGTDTAGHLQLAFVHRSPALDSILEASRRHRVPLAFDQLVAQIAEVAPESGLSEREEFVHELIRHNILITTLEPASTGGDPLDQLSQALTRVSSSAAADLQNVREHLQAVRSAAVGSGVDAVMSAEREVRRQLANPEHRHALQTDLFKPVRSLNLPPPLIEDVARASQLLITLSPAAPARLRELATAFRARYGDASVPLLQALDADNGLSFGQRTVDEHPLLQDIPFESASRSGRGVEWSGTSQLLLQEFERACRDNLEEITLTDEMVVGLSAAGSRGPPSSFFVMATVLSSAGSSTAGAKVVIRSAGGPSGANLIGRFCAGDPALAARVVEYLSDEERNAGPDTLFAEIVHRPAGRAGNVTTHPPLRRYELPVYGRSSVPKEQQIALHDVLVSVTPQGQIILTCATSGRRIVPRLTSAHNYQRKGIPVYEFLAALQLQDGVLSPFDWPAALASVSCLPRVVYGNCILAPRRWNLSKSQLARLAVANPSVAHEEIRLLAAQGKWPRFIELVEGDNRLVVDLENPVAVDCLIDEIAARPSAGLQEAFIPASSDFVRGPEGAYCNEILFPFVREPATSEPARYRADAPRAPGFGLGSEWLYLKLYAGSATIDRILIDPLAGVARELMERGSVDRWFFLRYSDPENHLRLRFHGQPEILLSAVVPALHRVLAALSTDGLVWRIETGTYEPETMRYGGPHVMEVAERMFHIDSECALALLEHEATAAPQNRWLWIARGVDQMWNDFGFDTRQRLRIYIDTAEQLRSGLAAGKETRFGIDRKFRAIRRDLAGVLALPASGSTPVTLIERRSERLKPHVEHLARLAAEPQALSLRLEDIVGSHVHMSINRLCSSMNTQQELVIYELLSRHYRGVLAREG